MFLIDTQNKKATPLAKKSFTELKLSERYDLQEWIVDNPQILGENLLIIQKEFDGFPDTNERLDLLALDENGKLVIIENKLDDSGKDVVWQALKYVSYCATLTKSEICEVYQRYLGADSAQEKIAEFYDGQDYDSIRLNPNEGDQRIILVAANFRKEVTSTVLWLRNYHGVDITCIKVTPYKDGETLYLDAEQIIPIQDIGDYQIRLTAKKQEETVLSKEEETRKKTYERFWEMALPLIKDHTGMYSNVSPPKEGWLQGASGHSGIIFSAIINLNSARLELFINVGEKDINKIIFRKLEAKRSEIENTFGKRLDWRERPDNKTSAVKINSIDYGLNDVEHWNEIASFFAENLSKMTNAFKPLIDTISKN